MRGLLIACGWAVTVAAAFLLGESMGRGGGGASSPARDEGVVRPLRAPPAALDEGPVLAPGAPRSAIPDRSRETPGPVAGSDADLATGETLEPFTLEGVTDPDVAMARLMRHVAALLAKGEDGHLDLLLFLDEHVANSEALERFFHREEDAVRYIVPWVEFLVNRKGPVLDVVESVFETMAERPETFAEIDKDTLEIFTEGAAVVLPGAVDEERLAKFRGYARAILDTPEGSLPEPVEKQRRRIQRALALWSPRLTPEDAVARLKSGELKGPEAVQALRQLSPEQLQGLDLGTILAPVVAGGDYRALQAMRDLPLQPRDVDLLDGKMLEAAATGKVRDWTVVQYLSSTKRHRWPQQQPFIEEGLGRGGQPAETCARALGRFGGHVPKDYVRWVLERHELSEKTVRVLERLLRED